jgi:hypothetical protein
LRFRRGVRNHTETTSIFAETIVAGFARFRLVFNAVSRGFGRTVFAGSSTSETTETAPLRGDENGFATSAPPRAPAPKPYQTLASPASLRLEGFASPRRFETASEGPQWRQQALIFSIKLERICEPKQSLNFLRRPLASIVRRRLSIA